MPALGFYGGGRERCQDPILEPNLLSRCAVGGVEVHELGFEVVAAVFLVGAGQDGIGITIDRLAGLDNLDTAAVAFGTTFWFRDV